MGVVAHLVLMVSTVLNLLAALVASVRGTTVGTGRADGASRHDRLIPGQWSILSLDRSASSAQPFTSGRNVAKSKNTKTDSTGNIFITIDDAACFLSKKIVDICLKQNYSFGRRGVVTDVVNQSPSFGGRSASRISSHITAIGGNYASRIEGFSIPT